MLSANTFNLSQSQNLSFGRALTLYKMTKFWTGLNSKHLQIKKSKFALKRVGNMKGKGENAGYQPFSTFPTMFSKGFFHSFAKSRDHVVKG